MSPIFHSMKHGKQKHTFHLWDPNPVAEPGTASVSGLLGCRTRLGALCLILGLVLWYGAEPATVSAAPSVSPTMSNNEPAAIQSRIQQYLPRVGVAPTTQNLPQFDDVEGTDDATPIDPTPIDPTPIDATPIDENRPGEEETDNPDAPEIAGLTFCPQSNTHERRMAQAMFTHPQQGRIEMRCNAILTRVAKAKAGDMASRNYVDHLSPEGIGPNLLVLQAGFELPSLYSREPAANNIESLAAGLAQVEATWESWVNTQSHRPHILGLTDFFANQLEYGIAYVYDPQSKYLHYWVVLTAPSSVVPAWDD